jgi:hypothetical protein
VLGGVKTSNIEQDDLIILKKLAILQLLTIRRINIMNFVILVITVVLSFQAHAGFYKCVVDGKTTFSGTPCGDTAEELMLKISKPNEEKTPTSRKQVSSRTERANKFLEQAENERAALGYKRKIIKSEKRIKKLHRLMDTKIALLELKKSRANNNLAGATWESSISQEISTVLDRYKIKIESKEAKLRSYREALVLVQN